PFSGGARSGCEKLGSAMRSIGWRPLRVRVCAILASAMQSIFPPAMLLNPARGDLGKDAQLLHGPPESGRSGSVEPAYPHVHGRDFHKSFQNWIAPELGVFYNSPLTT